MGKASTVKSLAEETFRLKPYTQSGLAVLYGVSLTTIKKWLKPMAQEIGERKGWYFSIKQVDIIVKKLGLPETITED